MAVLRARVLTPTEPGRTAYLDDAIVGIDGENLSYVGPYDGRPVDEDLRPGVLVPGFVDAHLHFPQTRIVGAASGPLLDWLAQSTFPEEARFADDAHAVAVAGQFATNLAAAGTTLALVYGPVFPRATEILANVLRARGQRAILGPVLMDSDSPPELTLPVGPALDGLEALVEKHHGKDGLELAVIPRFALSCTPEMMRRGGDFARRRGLRVSTHLAENLVECRIARERFRSPDYLRIYEDAGLLVPGSVYAHCIHLSDDELDRFASAGAVVAHCPDSNFFLGSGRMNVDKMRDRGIPIAIGTDIAAGRSFRVPRILSAAYDNALAVGITLTPGELLWAGTRGGALALGHAETGAIAAGFAADLVCIDVPAWATDEQAVLAHLLFDHDAPRPRRTWVRGHVVWTNSTGESAPR